jgi:uncharacterized protein DUF1844
MEGTDMVEDIERAQGNAPDEKERGEADSSGPETPESETARTEAGPRAVPIVALPTVDLLMSVLNLLAAKAWEGMGLVPNPATNQIQKDLGEARLAIDAYAVILETLHLHVEDQPRRDLETLLMTLRINFVEKSGAS